jgi:glycosyltransferase involved in cell wall biosynthesis
MTAKILICYDVEKWTWHRRACDIQAFAPDRYDVTPIGAVEFSKRCRSDENYPARFDAVFAMDWPGCDLRALEKAKRVVALVTSSGLLYDKVDHTDWQTWIVTDSRNATTAKQRLPEFDALIAVNRKICDEAKRYNSNTHLLGSGVNDEFYTPHPLPASPKVLRIGWCANPMPSKISGKSVKGHDELLQPMMKWMKNAKWCWRLNTRNYKNALTRSEMLDWYHSVDVFLCTSLNDGTPSPVFEAACAGRVVVSTDVGCVADWERPHELDLIAPAYSNLVQAHKTQVKLIQILERLYDERDNLALYAREIRDSCIDQFSWRHLAPKYLDVIVGNV